MIKLLKKSDNYKKARNQIGQPIFSLAYLKQRTTRETRCPFNNPIKINLNRKKTTLNKTSF